MAALGSPSLSPAEEANKNLAWNAPPLLPFLSNKSTSWSISSPVNFFPPSSRCRSMPITFRSGGCFVQSLIMQAVMASDSGSRWAALGALALDRMESAIFGWDGLCAVPQPLLFLMPLLDFNEHNSSSPCTCAMKMSLSSSSSTEAALFSQACCSSMLVAFGGKMDVEDCIEFQVLEVNRRKVDLRFGFSCLDDEPQNFQTFTAASCYSGLDLDLMIVPRTALSDLPVGQCQSAIWALGLLIGGVDLIGNMCFFVSLRTRIVDGHSEDGVFRSFGLIHRWQVRELLLLIPRCDEREKFKLSSVLHPTNLQLSSPQPLVHMPARLSGESLLYGWLARPRPSKTSAVVECQPSQLTRHQTPVVVFSVFGLFFSIIVILAMQGSTCTCSHVESIVTPSV